MQGERPTRKETTERTRARLLEGAIDLLRREGVAAATTGRIAQAAGLKQPTFYVHFADRDAILEAAAAEIGQRMLDKLRRQHTRFDAREVRGSVRGVYASVLAAFLSEPELTRIFLRHRADDGTVLGRAFSSLLDRGRAELRESLPAYGVALPPATAAAHVELIVSSTLGLLEALLEGRLRDREIALDLLADVTTDMLRAARAARHERS